MTPKRSPQQPAGIDPAFDHDVFLLRQPVVAIDEKYMITDEQGQPVCYVERPAHLLANLRAALVGLLVLGALVAGGFATVRAVIGEPSHELTLLLVAGGIPVAGVAAATVAMALSMKRHVTFYRDSSRGERLLHVKQPTKQMFGEPWYTVQDARGEEIARLRKSPFSDVFRKAWTCTGPSGQRICTAQEASVHAILSRTAGAPFPMNFQLYRGYGGDRIGEFTRRFTFVDKYVLDLSGDPGRTVDRRVALALAVILDTGEKR